MVWSHCYHPAICPPWLLAPCCSWIYMHMDQDVAGCSLYALILICGIYIWYHIHICSCIRIVPTMHPGPFPCWAPSAISNHPGKSIELRLSTWHGAAACNAVRPQLGTSGGNKHTWCQFFSWGHHRIKMIFVYIMFCEFMSVPSIPMHSYINIL